jgi:hypothetical protein
VFDLVSSDLNLCPQRDSNPRCRLESAKPGIFRNFPRSFVTGRNMLRLGHTVESELLLGFADPHLLVLACVLHAPSILGLMDGTTRSTD